MEAAKINDQLTNSAAAAHPAKTGSATKAIHLPQNNFLENLVTSSPAVLQCKLTIGAPNDPFEREADQVAEKVMQMSDLHPSTVSNGFTQSIQRKCSHCEEEEKQVWRKPIAATITPYIQTKGGNGAASEALSNQINATRGVGSSIPESPRNFMESRFGSDFKSVKIHTDNKAVEMNRGLNAKAFTVGNDIYFNQGQYQPETSAGKLLLAHELTHVVQQQGDKEGVHLQRLVLNFNDFDQTNTIVATNAVVDPAYIDNGIIDWTMRSDGSVMTPTFTAFTLFYQDGTIFDIPAASNSYFPNFATPSGPTVTVHLRHQPTGKIFPITYSMADFLAAPDPTNISTIPNPQFLFLRRPGGTPNILWAFDQEIVRLAFAFAGLLAQLWNVGLGVRGAVQIFQLSGALRAAAAARTAAHGGGAAPRAPRPSPAGAAGPAVAGASTPSLATIVTNILRTGTLSAAEVAQIAAIRTRLISIVQNAIRNVNNGTATGAWAQRLATTPASSGTYRMALGNAIHEESFNLIQQEIATGALPAGIRTNIGRAVPAAGLPNAYGTLRPDIRIPLSAGREAIFDITTTGQAGHASKYNIFTFVEYIAELLY